MDDKGKLERIRHSASHIMASAILKLYPKAKLAIGPAVEDGFYYDFDDLKLSDSDFDAIEAEMKRQVKANLVIEHKDLSFAEARELFKDQPYQLELIDGLEKAGEKTVSTFTHGDFTDLCKGPHVMRTGNVKAFKVMKLAGAYWHGDSDNKMLTRVLCMIKGGNF